MQHPSWPLCIIHIGLGAKNSFEQEAHAACFSMGINSFASDSGMSLPKSMKLWQAKLLACKQDKISDPSQFLTKNYFITRDLNVKDQSIRYFLKKKKRNKNSLQIVNLQSVTPDFWLILQIKCTGNELFLYNIYLIKHNLLWQHLS